MDTGREQAERHQSLLDKLSQQRPLDAVDDAKHVWWAELEQYGLESAAALGAHLLPTQVAELLSFSANSPLDRVSYQTPAWEDVIQVLMKLPHVTTQELLNVAHNLDPWVPNPAATLTTLLSHPATTEEVVEVALWPLQDDIALLELAAHCGWLVPVVHRLVNTGAFDAYGMNFDVVPSLAVLEQLLAYYPPAARRIAISLGAGWVGTVDELVAVAVGIIE